MSNFCEINHLGITTHRQIPFVDVPVATDIPLFLDADLIAADPSPVGRAAARSIETFFNALFDACRARDYAGVYALLNFAHEPNETHLGLSQGKSRGKGASPLLLLNIFRQLIDQNCFCDGLILQPTDISLWTPNFGPDRMSDLLTNIIRHDLAQFTWEQYAKLGLADIASSSSATFWDADSGCWKTAAAYPLFLANGHAILLTPKSFVCTRPLATPDVYLRNHVLRYRQQYLQDSRSPLCRTRVDKHGEMVFQKPSKKAILCHEVGARPRKDYMREHTLANPRLLSDFHNKNRFAAHFGQHGLSDEELDFLVYGTRKVAL